MSDSFEPWFGKAFDEEVKLNLESVIAWQFDQINQLIIQGIVEGRDMTNPDEAKRIMEIVAERTKEEFGIE